MEVMASGGKMLLVPGQTAEKTARQFERTDSSYGQREWPALLRILDKKDPSYRN
jgi:hypothetical protein